MSKWDPKNVNNMKFMFFGVDKKIIPEIFKKKIKKNDILFYLN